MNANQQKCTRRDEMRLILPRHVDFVNLDRIRVNVFYYFRRPAFRLYRSLKLSSVCI